MNVYVDSSVLLRIVLKEPRRLRLWSKISAAFSSELTQAECLRTIDRAHLRYGLTDAAIARQRGDVFERLRGFQIVGLDRSVLERAGGAFPTTLGTLDAIHLASASLARDEYPDLVLATHDAELATGARALGFEVAGV